MYIGAIPTPAATESRQEFTATANQTVFNTTGGTVGYCDCYLNGVKMAASDFSFDGADVTLTTGAAAGDVLAVVMRQADNALVALPITDSAGNNVLSEAGGVVTLGNATLGGDVAMASSGLTVRNITQVAMTSNISLANDASLTTFFAPTYTPLFAGSKVLGILTFMGYAYHSNGNDGRKKLHITLSGSGITTIRTNDDEDFNIGTYDYGGSGIQYSFHQTITLPLVTTSTTDVMTATCALKNASTSNNIKWQVVGNNTLEETFMTWMEFK